MPAAHSQQAPRQSAGIHPGCTEPEERLPVGTTGRRPGCEKPQRQWRLGGTCPPPALGRDPRLALMRTPAGRSSSAAQPHRTRQEDREGPAPGCSQAPPPSPARPRKRPGTAALGGGGPVARSWRDQGTEGSRRLPRCPARSPGTSCGDRRSRGTLVPPAGPRRPMRSPRVRPRGGSAAAAAVPGADGPGWGGWCHALTGLRGVRWGPATCTGSGARPALRQGRGGAGSAGRREL